MVKGLKRKGKKGREKGLAQPGQDSWLPDSTFGRGYFLTNSFYSSFKVIDIPSKVAIFLGALANT